MHTNSAHIGQFVFLESGKKLSCPNKFDYTIFLSRNGFAYILIQLPKFSSSLLIFRTIFVLCLLLLVLSFLFAYMQLNFSKEATTILKTVQTGLS